LGTNEGGQLTLNKGTANNWATHLDNYQDQFRILGGADLNSNTSHLVVNHPNGFVGIAVGTPQYTLHVAGDVLTAKRAVVATTTDTNVTTTKTVDLSVGSYFVYTMTGSTTFTFNNAVASGNAHSFTIVIKQDATGSRVPTWSANIKFAGGSAPPYTANASAVDIWTFTTYDGGTTYVGTLAVKDAR
jgi:hypothetical protein